MINQRFLSPDITKTLSAGDVRKANELAASQYVVRGIVVHGNHLGRTLGFPTANLQLPENEPFLLAYGVYAVKVELDNMTYGGMANAGIRPTISGKTLSVEVNVFDFSGDLYGTTISVYFIDRIRDERKFENLGLLVQQITLDKQKALTLLP
jgi:riboflavin kinase/FMN adenylyltransferase